MPCETAGSAESLFTARFSEASHTDVPKPGRDGKEVTVASAQTATANCLFAYGTLRVPEVVTALLGRVPAGRPAWAAGWRAARLAGRSYPGLVPAPGATADGLLMVGLTPEEWAIVDAFEGPEYQRRRIRLDDGTTAVAYLWRDLTAVREQNWSLAEFVAAGLADFLRHCLP
jgi:gamma-glutamylcyclotransferase (GGCT)/AIG2-like uncharacterized protein YtfP